MSAERWEGEWQPGIPADRRLASKRLRDANSTLGDFEFSAARVVARYLGERVELIDDGSSDALVDGRIVYHDRPVELGPQPPNFDHGWGLKLDVHPLTNASSEIPERRFNSHSGTADVLVVPE